jgi:hypothetical protein
LEYNRSTNSADTFRHSPDEILHAETRRWKDGDETNATPFCKLDRARRRDGRNVESGRESTAERRFREYDDREELWLVRCTTSTDVTSISCFHVCFKTRLGIFLASDANTYRVRGQSKTQMDNYNGLLPFTFSSQLPMLHCHHNFTCE